MGSYLQDLLASDAETWARLRDRNPALELVASTVNDQRTVDEITVTVDTSTGRWPLPVAVVTDINRNGSGWARVYHSMWPLTGQHEVRSPLLAQDPTIGLSGAVADYQRALAVGDVESVLATYEPDAIVREPSGGPYSFSGEAGIRRLYTLQFANGGGIGLEFCTATDDGRTCAIEYNAVRWGNSELAPQAGVAVYVRGASGRLAAARIYDDIAPPAVSDTASS